jgi:hypothetical protein
MSRNPRVYSHIDSRGRKPVIPANGTDGQVLATVGSREMDRQFIIAVPGLDSPSIRGGGEGGRAGMPSSINCPKLGGKGEGRLN